MIQINIDPTLIQAGPLIITWHGFFTAVGVLAGIMLASKYGFPRRSSGSGLPGRKRARSGAFLTTKTLSGRFRPRVSATSRYESFVAITTCARRNARRSNAQTTR